MPSPPHDSSPSSLVRAVCFFFTLCLLLGGPAIAHASPRRDAAIEDAQLDGDVDAYDVSLGRFRSAPREVLPRARSVAFVVLEGFISPNAPRAVYGGGIVVGVAFDSVVRGARSLSSPRPPLADGRLQDGRSGSPTDRAPAPAPPPVAATPSPSRLLLLPSPAAVRSLVSAAWRAAGASASDAEIDSIARRARASAILPETRVRGMRNDSGRLAFDGSGDDVRVSDSEGAHVTLEARFTWRFDRLVYADDEPSLERLRQDRQELRMRLANRVVELLFHRERARLEVRLVGEGTREALEAEIRVIEYEAALDVLTDGWFSMSALARGQRDPR